jgi:predicted MFS family arabinose efflux permease
VIQQFELCREAKFDFVGSTVFGLAIMLLMYGLSLIPSFWGGALIAAGVSGFAIFIWLETKAPNPILNVSLFRHNIVFTFSNLSALISYSATFAIVSLLSLYLQYIKEFGPQMAGIMLIAQPVLQAAVSPYAGKLSDRMNAQKLAAAGLGLNAAGLFMLSFLNAGTSLILLTFALVILGAGFGLFSSPNANTIISSVSKKILWRSLDYVTYYARPWYDAQYEHNYGYF